MTRRINETFETSVVSPKFPSATLEIRKSEVNFYSNKYVVDECRGLIKRELEIAVASCQIYLK